MPGPDELYGTAEDRARNDAALRGIFGEPVKADAATMTDLEAQVGALAQKAAALTVTRARKAALWDDIGEPALELLRSVAAWLHEEASYHGWHATPDECLEKAAPLDALLARAAEQQP